jgi:hypothetical protein
MRGSALISGFFLGFVGTALPEATYKQALRAYKVGGPSRDNWPSVLVRRARLFGGQVPPHTYSTTMAPSDPLTRGRPVA